MDKTKTVLLVILIMAIAVFLRVWHLNSIPPGVYPDEAMNGNNAIQAIKTNDYKVYYPENNGREGLFINLEALSFKIFGIHVWSLKLISVLAGILAVLGLYFLTKKLFQSINIALLAMFFMTVSFWHINFSRIAFRAIMVPFLLVWSFYFLFKVMNFPPEKRKRFSSTLYLILSGILLGLGFHTYIAFRMSVIILMVPLLVIVLKFFKEYKISGGLFNTFFKNGFWQYKIWAFAIILAALPIGLYFLHNPQDFIGRASGISVLAQKNPLKAVIESTIKTLGMFNVVGDKNWRHNFSGSPQLYWPVGILFLIGIISSIKEFFKSLKTKTESWGIHLFLFVWFGVMLLPAILTAEALPHALRTIGVIPVCYIYAAWGGWIFYKFLAKGVNKKLLVIASLVFLILCAYIGFDKYFVDWARQPVVEYAFAKDFVDMGKYLNQLPPEVSSYVIVNQSGVLVPVLQNGKIKDIPMPAQTIIFIRAMNNENRTTIYLPHEEIDSIQAKGKLVIIPLQYDAGIFKKLKEKYPQGNVTQKENFWVFELNVK